MGQAKRRGTLEQRIDQFYHRAVLVAEIVAKHPESPMAEAVRRFGVQHVSDVLQRRGSVTYKPKEPNVASG